jgi:hypothetical protein
MEGGRSKMKRLFALPAIALLSLGATACGGSSKGPHSASQSASRVASSGSAAVTTPSSTAPTQHYLNDGDNDPNNDNDPDDRTVNKIDEDNDSPEDHMNPQNDRYHDKDDDSIVASDHAASAAEKRAITALVKRYYTVAAAGDGATACSMIYSTLVEAIPEDYGQAPGPVYLRGGKTCQAVMSLLFRHFHSQLTGAIEVTGVRVKGNHALALLGSKTVPASMINMERERGAWKIDELLGVPLP